MSLAERSQHFQAAPRASGGAFPRVFGQYVLLSAFAQGGMGEVFLAKTGGIAGVDRHCVLKKIRPDVTATQEYVNRFIDEARLVVQLNHANICHVFDAGRVGSEYYLAMEYVPGVNLKDLIARETSQGRKIPPEVAIWIGGQVLEALDYAHRHKHPLTGKPLHLVHRDVSPQNVMVSYDADVKLIDFGLAASDIKVEQTESQVVMGKVAYMAPEQARGHDVDHRTDQFAAAIVLYELLTGERYYGEKNNYEIWQVVGRGDFVASGFDKIEPALAQILRRALAGDAGRRFSSCADFKDALDTYAVTHQLTATKRKVQELMTRAFADEVEAERTFLTRFEDVSGVSARSAEQGESFIATAEQLEPTRTLAGAAASGVPTASMPSAVGGDVTSIVPRADKEDTEAAMLAAYGKKSSAVGLLVASGVAATLMAVVVVIVLRQQDTRPSATPDAPARPAAAGDPAGPSSPTASPVSPVGPAGPARPANPNAALAAASPAAPASNDAAVSLAPVPSAQPVASSSSSSPSSSSSSSSSSPAAGAPASTAAVSATPASKASAAATSGRSARSLRGTKRAPHERSPKAATPAPPPSDDPSALLIKTAAARAKLSGCDAPCAPILLESLKSAGTHVPAISTKTVMDCLAQCGSGPR